VRTLESTSLDPWLLGSPLRRPAVARRVTTLLAFLLLVAAAMSLLTFAGMGADGSLVFARALALSTLLSIPTVALLRFLDRRERESPWLYAIAFLWGGVIAAWLSMPLNTIFIAGVERLVERSPELRELLGAEAALLIGAPIAAPLVEELAKGLGVLLLFALLRAEFDNARDGFVYGALVGAGFNWAEAALYVAQGFEQFGSAPFGLQLGSRYALLGLAGHALFSGLFGAFLGLARQSRGWTRWLWPPLGLLLAMLAHAANNVLPLVVTLIESKAGNPPPRTAEPPPDLAFVDAWLSASAMKLVLFLPFVLLVTLLLWRSGRYERRVIREELAGEQTDTVTPDEQRAIAGDGLFRTRRIEGRDRRFAKTLVRLQHELAFRKRRVRDRDGDPEADPLVARWRDGIRRLRSLA
jgi:RsiW-degrading membrane proteinase PrsW (M82 family)